MQSDSELLLRYAHDRDETAFAELVRAHIDLVYSAALRRVGGDSHAATEITQEVFLAMSRHAERLARHPVLNAWLHTSTRNAASNLRRRAHRRERQTQEILAVQTLHSSTNLSGEWQAVRDTLDTALDELNETDRQAIILRFFEGQSYPAMGEMLGLKEETARMRVGRALEKLRARLARRGIASTAAILGGALTSHAVVAAPAGLAAKITTTVVSSAVVVAMPAAGLIHLMSTTKLVATLTAVAVIAGVSLLVYPRLAPPATLAVTPPAKPTAPKPGSTPPAANLGDDSHAANLAALLQRDQTNRAATASRELTDAAEKIAALRDILARLPEQSIPELKLTTNGDWHLAVDGRLETPEDFRRALGKIRSAAETRFAKLVHPAVQAYLQANAKQFPTDPLQLASFIGPEIDRAMLQRYKVVPATTIANMGMGGDWAITQASLIDSDFDSTTVIGSLGFGSTNAPITHAEEIATLRPVMNAYQAAHGKRHNDLRDLAPYVTTPDQQAVIVEWERRSKVPH